MIAAARHGMLAFRPRTCSTIGRIAVGALSPIVRPWLFVLLLVTVLLSAAGGRAGELPAVGEVHRSTLFVFGKPVPLPPGDWTVIGQGYGPVTGPSPGAYGVIGGVMLVQHHDGIVDGIVLAHANLLPVEAGWGPAGECRRLDAVYATGVRTRARNLSCGYVLILPATDRAVARLPAWTSGRIEATRRGWRLPGALALAGIRAGDRRDVVDVRYAWAAEAAPGPDAKPRVQRASASLVPPPLRLRASALAPWVVRALAELEGRIDDPLAATTDLPLPGTISRGSDLPAGASRWQRRLGIAMTNRLIHASLSVGAGLVVTGSAYTAAVLGAWQTVAGGVGGHVVELGWEWEAPRPAMEFGADPAAPTG